jgi:hypothetical protein
MKQDALARLEALVDASGVAPRLEALLPLGVRGRQLSVRTDGGHVKLPIDGH